MNVCITRKVTKFELRKSCVYMQAICVLLAALSVRDHNADAVVSSESDEDEEDEEQPSHGPYSPFARWQLSERYLV